MIITYCTCDTVSSSGSIYSLTHCMTICGGYKTESPSYKPLQLHEDNHTQWKQSFCPWFIPKADRYMMTLTTPKWFYLPPQFSQHAMWFPWQISKGYQWKCINPGKCFVDIQSLYNLLSLWQFWVYNKYITYTGIKHLFINVTVQLICYYNHLTTDITNHLVKQTIGL